MSSRIKVRLNLAGVNAMMRSPEVQAALQDAGDAVARQASDMGRGAAYEASTHLARWVAITNVYPASQEAAHDNFAHNTLLKAAGAAGLFPTKKAAKREGKL